jgi:hypothetical protein
MAAVFTQMNGDAVGPSQNGQGCGMDDFRLSAPPSLPNGCHVIDVHA